MMKGEYLGVLLALFAGAWTFVGGLVVFCTRSLKPLTFSAALSLSAGVMVYVSFVEIIGEASVQIREGWPNARKGMEYIIVCAGVFGGWFFSDILNWFVGFILIKTSGLEATQSHQADETMRQQLRVVLEEHLEFLSDEEQHTGETELADRTRWPIRARRERVMSSPLPLPFCPSLSPQVEFQAIQTNSPKSPNMIETNSPKEPPSTSATSDDDKSHNRHNNRTCLFRVCQRFYKSSKDNETKQVDKTCSTLCLTEKVAHVQFAHDKKAHGRIGLFTALCLALHNFPEGIATWSATVVSPKLGLGIAIAIAIHNIPEGTAIAVPIYYSTKSVGRALLYAGLAGLAEPLGALFAWAAFGATSHHSLALGVIFAAVGGIMIHVSLTELYPVAWKYDPKDRVTTKSFVIGMLIMAASIVLFHSF